jgi:hypothetical protein
LQHHIAAFDLGKFFQQCARSVTKASSLHPARQRLPQNVGKEAHQDVSPDAMLLLVSDRSNAKLILGSSSTVVRPFSP